MRAALCRGWLLVFACLLCQQAGAQSYPFRIYGLEQGLPQSSARCFVQDNYGFLWVGTQVGLARFDGLKFKVFTVDEGLAANDISALVVDKSGTLWIGTQGGGISRFDGPGFTNFTTAQGLPSNYVKDLIVTHQGQLFAATETGLAHMQENAFHPIPLSDPTLSARITALAESTDSTLMVGGDAGMFLYDSKRLVRITGKNSPLQFIQAMAYHGKDSLYIGTSRGLWLYSTATHKTTNIPLQLSSPSILTLLSSKAGLWAGGPEGVALLESKRSLYFTQKNGLPGKHVLFLSTDREGNVWICTHDGGLVQYNGFQFEMYGMPEGLPDQTVWDIHQDRQKRYWFGTENGMALLQDGTITDVSQRFNLLDKSINAFSEDTSGNIWFAYTYKGIGWYDGTRVKNIPLETVGPVKLFRDVICAPDGSVWVATSEGILNYNQGNVKHYKTPRMDNDITNVFLDNNGMLWGASINGLMSIRKDSLHRQSTGLGLAFDVVNDIAQTQDETLWLVTDGGLVKFKDGKFKSYTPPKYYPNSQIMWSIQPDSMGNLWIGATRGIYRFTQADSSFRFYGQREGFLPQETNVNAVSRDSEGNIWFGTVKGAVKYNPRKDEISMLAPRPYISGIRLNNGTEDWHRFASKAEGKLDVPAPADSNEPLALKVPYDYNTLSFDYVGLHYKIPENNQYKYRLTGLNDDFSPPTSRTTVDYTSLQPGIYTMEVHAANSDGKWTTEPARLTFEILPPWYRTFWAYLAYVCVGVASAYSFLRLRDKRYQAKTFQLEELINQRTRETNEEAAALERALNDKEQTLENLRTTQRQLVQQEKMAALGSLVSNTAHDINTPLGVIRANSAYIDSILPELLQTLPVFLKSLTESEMQAFQKLATQSSGQDLNQLSTREVRSIKSTLEQQMITVGILHAEELMPKLIQCGITSLDNIRPLLRNPRLDEILSQAARLRQLRINLQNISSSAEKTRKVVYSLSSITKEYNHTYRERIELKHIIEQVLQSYSTYLKARIRVYTKWATSSFIIANPDEIQQVFTHIIFNAIQALSKGGRFVIELMNDGDKVIVQLTDDGPGIPADAIPHIFEPFFTTKQSGEGSGLGLFITKKIVENHGGTIQLTSAPGRTTFTIVLTLANPETH